jgi:hypothetical protein
MTFYDKYPQLRNRAFLSKMLKNTVYATMALENQTVPEEKIEAMVQKLIAKKESEMPEFFTDETI